MTEEAPDTVARPEAPEDEGSEPILSDVVNLHIVSPEEVLLEAHVQWVEVPLEDGLIGIWPGHIPLVGALGAGQVRFSDGDTIHQLGVLRGFLRVTREQCVVMVSLLAEDGATLRELPEEPPDKDQLFDDLAEVLEDVLDEQVLGDSQEE